MRIREVRAHAFGPFEGETLELSESMTVIVGPNESGKSSWHAAICAGLCGMRRGPGLKAEDREFRDRHMPWDGDEWRVSTVVDLPDGRTVELIHDLGNRVGSSARDVLRGTDYSNEIVHDGAPDGSKWLGLDRRAFLGVASIRQAQILSVTEEAGSLQEHLQRAAATAGADETAAAALKAIDDYASEEVGTRRANSRKPLMQAVRGLEAAQESHDLAAQHHEDWLERKAKLARLTQEASQTRRLARAAEARLSRDLADQLTDRLGEARELAERYPSPPSQQREREKLAEQIATALHDWEQRPDPTPLEGPTAEELAERLQSLPEPPEGDIEPAAEVRSAHRQLLDAHSRYEAHQQQKPPDLETAAPTGITESELIDLARELDTPVPSVEPAIREEVERLRQAQISLGDRGSRVPGVAAGAAGFAALLIGAVLLATGATVGGVVGVGVGMLLGLVAVALLRKPLSPGDDRSALVAAESRLMMAEQLAAAAIERRESAARRAEAEGLDPDPARLRRLADQLRRAEEARSSLVSWEDRERNLGEAVTSATEVLRVSLSERQVPVDEDAGVDQLEAAFSRYEEECRRRREQAGEARERPALEQALGARRRAEERLAEDIERVQRAGDRLRQAATAAALTDDPSALTESELVTRLKGWQQDLETSREELERAQREWSRLEALLDGGTLEELEAVSRSAEKRFAALAEDLDEKVIQEVSLGDDPELTIDRLREEADMFERECATSRGDLEARAEQVVGVPEAEEQLAAAQQDLTRVESLAGVLDTTKRFLSQAQDRVHRDIAPVLRDKVGDRLFRVSGGRYVEVTVDPETLKVDVRDVQGRWRDANLLSHGTAEQVYLLLRVAMAEVLTASGANCPLLLDDSTVQSDPERTHAILDVLHDVSSEHQVIVFSQENDVLAWAEENLGVRDQLRRLTAI